MPAVFSLVWLVPVFAADFFSYQLVTDQLFVVWNSMNNTWAFLREENIRSSQTPHCYWALTLASPPQVACNCLHYMCWHQTLWDLVRISMLACFRSSWTVTWPKLIHFCCNSQVLVIGKLNIFVYWYGHQHSSPTSGILSSPTSVLWLKAAESSLLNKK